MYCLPYHTILWDGGETALDSGPDQAMSQTVSGVEWTLSNVRQSDPQEEGDRGVCMT